MSEAVIHRVRVIRREEVKKSPSQHARDHALGLIRALAELYPKDAWNIVRDVVTKEDRDDLPRM